MALQATSDVSTIPAPSQKGEKRNVEVSYPKPLKLSGALHHFKFEESTPVIGREFLNVDIVDDLLNADNADERLRDLAITSKSQHHLSHVWSLTIFQFPNAASSSSARSPE